jgi:hypothetical protein
MIKWAGMTQDNDEHGDHRELLKRFDENSRPWQTYWFWRDRPLAEREAAATVLTGAGFQVEPVRSREVGDDPPDCEALVDGTHCGIEVTELVHRSTLKRSIQAVRAREKGREPDAPEAYFAWERNDLLEALQRLISRKDKAKPKGGPYGRYILVIVTDEFFLDRYTVEGFLDGATFETDLITDVLLGLSYHPSPEPDGGSCPVFRLCCGPRNQNS